MMMLLIWGYVENHRATRYAGSEQLLDIEQITLHIGVGFPEAKW